MTALAIVYLAILPVIFALALMLPEWAFRMYPHLEDWLSIVVLSGFGVGGGLAILVLAR